MLRNAIHRVCVFHLNLGVRRLNIVAVFIPPSLAQGFLFSSQTLPFLQSRPTYIGTRFLSIRTMDLQSLLQCSRGPTSCLTDIEIDSVTPLPCGWEQCLDLMSGFIYFKDDRTGFCTNLDPRLAVASQGTPFSHLHDRAIKRRQDGETTLSYTSNSNDGFKYPVLGRAWTHPDVNYNALDLDLKLASKNEGRKSSCSSLSSFCVSDIMGQRTLQSQMTPSRTSSFSFFNLSLSSSDCSFSNSSPSVVSFQGDDGDEALEVESSRRFEGTGEECIGAMITAGCVRCLMYVLLPQEDPRCPKCGHAVLDFPLAPVAGNMHRPELQTLLLFV
eukprot:c53873_g1_i1 orf=332-1318(-)